MGKVGRVECVLNLVGVSLLDNVCYNIKGYGVLCDGNQANCAISEDLE